MAGVNWGLGQKRIEALADRLDALGSDELLHSILDEIGAHLMIVTDERFTAQEGPDLETREVRAWQPLSEEYLAANPHRKDRPILTDTTRLRDSIVYQVEGSRLNWGTNVVYAAAHQFGYKGIAARPYLGLSKDDDDEVLAIIESHMSKAT